MFTKTNIKKRLFLIKITEYIRYIKQITSIGQKKYILIFVWVCKRNNKTKHDSAGKWNYTIKTTRTRITQVEKKSLNFVGFSRTFSNFCILPQQRAKALCNKILLRRSKI